MRNIDPDYLDRIRPDLEKRIRRIFPEEKPEEIEDYVLFTAHLMREHPANITRKFYTFMHTGLMHGRKLSLAERLYVGGLYLIALEQREPRINKVLNNNRPIEFGDNTLAAVCAATFIGDTKYLQRIANAGGCLSPELKETAAIGLRSVGLFNLYQQNQNQPQQHD